MDTDRVDPLDLETGSLKLVDDETKWGRGVGTGENVLVHEQSPDQILILPVLTETSILQEENAIIVKHVMNLFEEGTQLANADVLSHLKAGDLLVASLGHGDISVVHA